jgi:hypothetical protein
VRSNVHVNGLLRSTPTPILPRLSFPYFITHSYSLACLSSSLFYSRSNPLSFRFILIKTLIVMPEAHYCDVGFGNQYRLPGVEPPRAIAMTFSAQRYNPLRLPPALRVNNGTTEPSFNDVQDMVLAEMPPALLSLLAFPPPRAIVSIFWSVYLHNRALTLSSCQQHRRVWIVMLALTDSKRPWLRRCALLEFSICSFVAYFNDFSHTALRLARRCRKICLPG